MMKRPSLVDVVNGQDPRFTVFEKYDKRYHVTGDDGDEIELVGVEDDDDAEEAAKEMGLDKEKIYRKKRTDETDIIEDNSTSNLDGGLGQPKVPHAFQQNRPSAKDRRKEYENATTATGYGVGQVSRNYTTKFEAMMGQVNDLLNEVPPARSEGISEVRYADWVADESMTPKQKINRSIREVSTKLYEIERTINRAVRLKSEVGLDQDVFWKSTMGKFAKISERMLRIGNTLREFNK